MLIRECAQAEIFNGTYTSLVKLMGDVSGQVEVCTTVWGWQMKENVISFIVLKKALLELGANLIDGSSNARTYSSTYAGNISSTRDHTCNSALNNASQCPFPTYVCCSNNPSFGVCEQNWGAISSQNTDGKATFRGYYGIDVWW